MGAFAAPAAAQEVGEVRVEGNRRAEKEAVLGVVRTKAGAPLDPETVSEDIRRIWSLRTFDDVVVEAVPGEQGALVVTFRVREKKSIREVRYEGADEVSEEDLKEVVNIQEFALLDVSEVQRNAVKIRDLYTEKGFFLAEVTQEVVPFDKHQVDVVFHIQEQAKVEVRRIAFIGNKAFEDSELKEAIDTKEGGFFSFMTGEGSFKKEVFERDVLMLNGHYYDRGYVNVKVGQPRTALSHDRTGLYVTIEIDEGEAFDLGDIEIKGDLLGPKEEIEALLTIEPGQVFNRSKLFQDLSVVGDFYKDKGYAYANVTPLTRTDEGERVVHVTIDIDMGKVVHFGRISIRGNQRTRDRVIRR